MLSVDQNKKEAYLSHNLNNNSFHFASVKNQSNHQDFKLFFHLYQKTAILVYSKF